MTTAPSVAIATVAALLVYSFARAIRSPLRRWRRRATLQPRLDSVMVGRGLLLFGFVCLGVVVLTHVAEWLRVFPGMGWGLRSSPGHYLNFVSAVLGCGLLIVGMIWISFNTRRSS